MHEYSIVQALIEQATEEARAHRASAIHRLDVRIGDQSGVDCGLLLTAFDTFRERTMCAEAELAISRVPVRWGCRTCGRPIEAGQVLRCSTCGAPARLLEGDEILLDRVELEVP